MAYTLEQTPTWAVAAVCTLIVLVSLIVERLINLLGRKLKEKKQKPLYEALEKMKEELMVMGFISLLLTVFQSSITNLCMPEAWAQYMLPCEYKPSDHAAGGAAAAPGVDNVAPPVGRRLLTSLQLVRTPEFAAAWAARRRLLEGEALASTCPAGKVPIISLEGLHQLHIFIFVMTIVHVVYSCVTVFLGFYKMHGWKRWEEETRAENYDSVGALRKTFKMNRQKTYIAAHKAHPLSSKSILSWLVSFFRQFGKAVLRTDYLTLRLGFISTHKLSPTFDFHSYIRRTLEDDFKVVVGISGSLWVFVVVFLLLNVHNWYTYFWIAFVPVLMILVVGTKLQHIIQQLALETAQTQGVIGVGHVKARDSLFWFNKPQILLYLIHFILFQNAFELAFFMWILTTFGFDSCVMGKAGLVLTRLLLGTAVQLLCSYSTLPLYALVTQMGTHYKKAIFADKTAQAIHGWHHKAKQNRKKNKGALAGKSERSTEESVQSTEYSLTASSRNLLHNMLLKSEVDPEQRIELLESRNCSEVDSPSGGGSAWDTEGHVRREPMEGEVAEVFALEVTDPAASTPNLTEHPLDSRMTWLRVQKLVMPPKGPEAGATGGGGGHYPGDI